MLSVKPDQLLGPLNDVEAKYAPPVLYVSGDPGVMNRGPRVSVIGSRRASVVGLENARALTRWLVEQGMVVVSGLAEGIDTAAHESAVSTGGRTIAVLGTPLDQFFPAKNRQLQLKIMREHLAISQFPSGIPAGKGSFPMRNRTMALISDATVIVEAGSNSSGTRHQGWEALRLGRPLFIFDEVFQNTDLEWPVQMLNYGAIPLCRSLFVLLEEMLPSAIEVRSFDAVA